MSFFRKLFGKTEASARSPISANQVDGLFTELADALATNARAFPGDALCDEVLRESGYSDVPSVRMRFGFSIANEVINIWLLNELIPRREHVTKLADLTHASFATRNSRRIVRIGDVVVLPEEAELLEQEISAATGESGGDILKTTTDMWSLSDILYRQRQETYQRALYSPPPHGAPPSFTPVTALAFELARHVTGDSKETGGERFWKLAAGLNAVLTTYANKTRETIPGRR